MAGDIAPRPPALECEGRGSSPHFEAGPLVPRVSLRKGQCPVAANNHLDNTQRAKVDKAPGSDRAVGLPFWKKSTPAGMSKAWMPTNPPRKVKNSLTLGSPSQCIPSIIYSLFVEHLLCTRWQQQQYPKQSLCPAGAPILLRE